MKPIRKSHGAIFGLALQLDQSVPEQLLKPIIHCPSAGKFLRKCFSAKNENGRTAFLCAKLWEFFSILLDNAKSDTDYVQKAINCINAEYINGITISR